MGGLIRLVAAIDESSADRNTGLRDPARQLAQVIGPFTGTFTPVGRTPHILLEEFQLFHTPPAQSAPRRQARTDDPRIEAQWREHARQPLPAPADLNKELDFHQIVSAMGSYPALLRRLGLVVDLLIAKAHFQQMPDGPLSIAVRFAPGTFTIPHTDDAPARC